MRLTVVFLMLTSFAFGQNIEDAPNGSWKVVRYVYHEDIEAISGDYSSLIRSADSLKDLYNTSNYLYTYKNKAGILNGLMAPLKIYSKAKKANPSEPYAKEMMEALKLQVIKEDERNSNYLNMIDKADMAFNEKLWDRSKLYYIEALQLNAAAWYPKDQIVKVDLKLVELKADEDVEARYNELVETGDKNFNLQNWEKSRDYYKKASTLKPDNRYPKLMIEQIDRNLKDLDLQEKIHMQYQKLIFDADQMQAAEQYDSAIELYYRASHLKPQEVYPVNQIKELEEILENQ